MMEIVPVNSLTTTTTKGQTEVTFARSSNDRPSTIPCRQQDIISNCPLSVRVTIPPGARIPDMTIYEGSEVQLVLQPSVVTALHNGE